MNVVKALGGVQLWENGPYFAECNVGATKPEEHGYYFWWGDTVGYKRNASNNGWVSVQDGSSFSFSDSNCPTYDKSNSQLQSEGYIDSTGTLVAGHDAARAHLGAPWRMPTNAEFSLNNCNTTWTTRNGVSGLLITGRGAYSSKSIFLPAAGNGCDSDLSDVGSWGGYCSSTLYSSFPFFAWCLCFDSGDSWRSTGSRYSGRSVRPVRGSADVGAVGVNAVSTRFAYECALPDGGPYTETVDGVEYTFLISDGKAMIGGALNDWGFPERAIPESASGALVIPSKLGGCPVTTIGEAAFGMCSSLTSVTIPNGVTTIGHSAFNICRSLMSVTIPEGVTTIGEFAFYCCSSLTSIMIPSSVTTIGENAFTGNSLNSFVVSSENSSYRAIDGILYTKDGKVLVACPCTLTSVTIPSGVITIGDNAFCACSLLTSVTISNGVTAIGNSAFSGCSSLTTVTIPSSVTTIGGAAFGECPLSEVWVEVGDEDRVKGLLADSGFDVSSLTFREIPKQGSDSGEGKHHITFVVSDGEASLTEASYPTNGVYGRLPEARREGFTFAGWYTAFDGGMRVGAFSTINPEVATLYARWVEQDASLYAQWAANAYTVNFNANGGSGAMAAQPFLYDQTQPLSANGFTKTGYTFKGWSTSPEGEVVFTDAAAVSNLTAEAGFTVALFAQWNKTVELDTDDISDWVAYDLADQYAAKHGTNARGYRDLFRSTFGNDYSAAFYKETGKVAADGARLQVWHDYVAGTDPLDPESKFTASMTMVDGKPVISWMPELDPERAALRKYTTYGKVKLTDNEWMVVPEGRASDYNFFKVTVEMK